MDHRKRRADILSAHPSVKELMRKDRRGKYVALCLVIAQTILAAMSVNLTWGWYIVVLYVVGATVAQALFLAIHELTHDLYFDNRLSNRLFSLAVNLPVVVPFAIAFRSYHLDHHRSLGESGRDLDLPSALEIRVTGSSRCMKAAWLACQLVAYALRPVLIAPQPITPLHLLNALAQSLYIATVVLVWGWYPVRFMLAAVFLAGGLHPTAGHFLTEHMVVPGASQETFSYYGVLNNVTLNVGYHVEHHDFSNIPGRFLPQLRKLAPDYYRNLVSHSSWSAFLFRFITDDALTLHSRHLK
jgi:sphingolipid delta-4 desaturase